MLEVSGTATHPLLRIPASVKRAGAEHRLDPRRHRQLRVENSAANFEVRAERCAGNEEPHDCARAFENGVDAAIAQETLDRDRLVATGRERFGCLVTTPPAEPTP